MNLKPEKGTPFRQGLTVKAIIVPTPPPAPGTVLDTVIFLWYELYQMLRAHEEVL